jgi:hypothetical protein
MKQQASICHLTDYRIAKAYSNFILKTVTINSKEQE